MKKIITVLVISIMLPIQAYAATTISLEQTVREETIEDTGTDESEKTEGDNLSDKDLGNESVTNKSSNKLPSTGDFSTWEKLKNEIDDVIYNFMCKVFKNG